MTTTMRGGPAPRGSHPVRDAETLAGLIDSFMEWRARRVLQHLDAAGLRLATAESCTGGLLASLFTDVKGASHVFERGVVAYDEDVKCELLAVPRPLIAEHGVVSRQVAVAMAEGLVGGCANAAVGVSVTGYADVGPEPGLVHMAIGWTDRPTVHRTLRFGGVGRGPVRLGTIRAAVGLLEETL